MWGLPEQLLAAIADRLADANWQRGGDGRARRPKPIPRPGVKAPETYAGDAMSIDEAREWLGW